MSELPEGKPTYEMLEWQRDQLACLLQNWRAWAGELIAHPGAPDAMMRYAISRLVEEPAAAARTATKLMERCRLLTAEIEAHHIETENKNESLGIAIDRSVNQLNEAYRGARLSHEAWDRVEKNDEKTDKILDEMGAFATLGELP